MKKELLIAAVLIAHTALSQPIPGTEIILFDMEIRKNKIILSNPVNITNRPGYDNQPFFHPDKPLVYYASADESGVTDILIYEYKKRTTQKFANTPEREYSPTLTPDKKFISCIVQREDGKQDLVKFPLDGRKPEVIIGTLTIGYHAWLTNDHVVVFVLGNPNSLRVFSVTDQRDLLITENVGRSLHRIPGGRAVSYVDKSLPEWLIKSYGHGDGSTETITQTVPGREDMAWTPDHKIVMSDGSTILFWQSGSDNWQPCELPSNFSLMNATRVAVNSTGNKLAVVVAE